MRPSKEDVLDEELYDEDGLLKEDKEETSGDKFNLINSMQKILQIKKKGRGAIRREAVKDSEGFIAVKRRGGGGGGSSLNKLLESVKTGGDEKVVEKVSKLVKAPSTKSIKTLETPLEKHLELKTKRTVLYDHAKTEVSRFNAIVYHNRVAEQMIYPINSGKKLVKQGPKERFAADFIPMTPLEEEMARVLYGEDYVARKKSKLLKPLPPSASEAYALSVEEGLHLHSEMSRLRAQQSYQMAKAKRQNKIKSKKYHRLLRKEKIRKQLKEFEELQQKDPEAAMEKLEELNKSRVQERMSLKHRNTSKWAKMQSARAKYNKDSRIMLSEQLKISKELTQKVQESSSEEDDPDLEIPQLVKSSMDNPWMLDPSVKDNQKMQLYYCGYKKLYEQINAKKAKELKQQEEDEEEEEIVQKITKEEEETSLAIVEAKVEKKKVLKKRKKVQKSVVVTAPIKKQKTKEDDEDVDKDFTEIDLDIMIEEAEDKIKTEASKTLKKLTKEEKQRVRALERRKKKEIAKKLKNKKKSKEGDVDEIQDFEVNPDSQLLENGEEEESTPSTPKKKELNNAATIDPNNYLKITKKSKKPNNKFELSSVNFAAFDADSSSEDEEEDQRQLIAEAFEDDQVVDAFRKQKEETIQSTLAKDIDLNLPGWGSWAGSGIIPKKKKNQKFIIKAPPPQTRKDSKLSHVILNEEAGEKIKDHMVNHLPFPFKSVKDFEKSIRAPVGRTWMPEHAMKEMTAPKIITRLGAIIEPLDQDVLAKKKGEGLKVPISIKRLAKVRK